MAMDGQLSMGTYSCLDALRQQAQKAAENYRQHEQQSGDFDKGNNRKLVSSYPSSRNHPIISQYSDVSRSIHSLEPQYIPENRQSKRSTKSGLGKNVNRLLLNTASNPTLTSSSGSNYGHAKWRAGILDLRSSCNGRPTAHARAKTIHGPHTGSRSQTHPQGSELDPFEVNNTYTSNKAMMSRSTNNMDVDDEDVNFAPITAANLRREYGSTSSLDKLGTNSDHFFSMLHEFQQSYIPDQRSPAPPRLQELLQGRLGSSSEPDIQTTVDSPRSGVRFMNGSTDSNINSDEVEDESKFKKNKSKNKERTQRAKSITGEIGVSFLKGKSKPRDGKQRAKSITGDNSVSLLKKLRGIIDSDTNKSENNGTGGEDSPAKYKGDLRRRSFIHYDCQSVGIDLGRVIQQRLNGKPCKSNTMTGASAASELRGILASDKDGPDLLADIDEGDGKSNDLVLSCPFFRNELGGEDKRSVSLSKVMPQKQAAGTHVSSISSDDHNSQVRHPDCCGIAILDASPSPSGQVFPPLVTHHGHVIEYVDHGAYYYRHFFYMQDHQNYFGMDENLGPIAISVRREKSETSEKASNQHQSNSGTAQYRIICRTCELRTLRGSILEDAVSSFTPGSRGIPIKDVLEVALPGVQLSCLRQAVAGQKTCDQLMKLDEQGMRSTYKVGIMYCRSGQDTEEQMYNNEKSGPALDEFLSLIGQRVRLKGFEQFRAGLDCKTDTTGTHSYYTTFNTYEIMFHVSTLLPYTTSNKQQLLRKRHIGNDIVTIVFQEPGAQAFSPQTVVSQFQHVFIIVRVSNPCSDDTRYSVAVSRSKDVPAFGPKVPENCSFKKSQEFVDFLLAKVINAENAAHKSEKFLMMATRTREEYLKDLAINYVTSTPIDSGSKLSKFGLGSGRRKDKSRRKVVPDMFVKGALVWDVQVEDMGASSQVDCLLAIASDTIVLVEKSNNDVICTIPCASVIGWTTLPSSLRLYYGSGECIVFRPLSEMAEQTKEIITRLQAFTNGAETDKLTLKRNGKGQLGFHIQPDGIVTDVEPYGYAWETGLRKGSRLVEICKVATITLSHDQILDLLRTSATVKVVIVSPLDDGSPRGNSSLNDISRFTVNIGKLTPSSSEHFYTHHQQQHSQPIPSSGLNPSLRYLNGVIHNQAITTDHPLCDGRNSFVGYSRQELADMYRSLHISQEDLTGSLEITSRSQSGQHFQHPFHRIERAVGSPVTSMDSGNFSSIPQNNGAARQFASIEYLSGIPPSGQMSLELLKQIQNKKYLVNKSQESSPQDSMKSSHSNNSSPRLPTQFDQAFETSANWTQNIKRNDFNMNSKEESTQTNNYNDFRTANTLLTKSYMEPFVLSPRTNRRNLSASSLDEHRTSSLPRSETSRHKLAGDNAKDFNAELLRLLDPNVSDKDLVGKNIQSQSTQPKPVQSQATQSHCLHTPKEITSNDNTHVRINGFPSQRPSPRTKSDFNSPRQRKTDSNIQQQEPFRKRSGSCDYYHDEEDQCSQDELLSPRPTSLQINMDSTSSQTSSLTTSNSSITNPSEQTIHELEKRLGKMSQDLNKTQHKKSTMVTEMQHLRADNVRLQEESQTAASQLRQFSEWFFNTIYQK